MNTILAKIKKKAGAGDADAQFDLGYMYYHGYSVPKDYAKAVKWFRLAADQGDAKAQRNLGCMYQRGQGVPKGNAKAVKWFRKAAEQGNADAQCNLGRMYESGYSVPKDYAKAMKCTSPRRRLFARAFLPLHHLHYA